MKEILTPLLKLKPKNITTWLVNKLTKKRL